MRRVCTLQLAKAAVTAAQATTIYEKHCTANPQYHVQEAFDVQYSSTLMDRPGHGCAHVVCKSQFLAGWKQQ